MDWFARWNTLQRTTSHSRHSTSTSHLLHHLLHHLRVVCHLLKHLRIYTTLLHHLLDLRIVHHLLHHLRVTGQLLEHCRVHTPRHAATTWYASSHTTSRHTTHTWHSATSTHATHTTHTVHTWHLLSYLSGLELCLRTILVEEIIRVQFERVLHLHHHWSNRFTHRCVQELLG